MYAKHEARPVSFPQSPIARNHHLAVFPVLASCLLTLTGCRPYDVPEYQEIETSHTAFLVPLEDDDDKQMTFASEEFLQKHKIATKRVQIPHKWVQKGRWWFAGEWIGTRRLITVDRAPITREWTASASQGTSAKNEALWVESQDSVGFSTGITCTARIPDEEAAIKFLFNYPGGSLANVMDTEIRARIQNIMARKAAEYIMDELRSRKNEIMDEIETDVIPFFENRGIEITTIGQFGGFTYENKEIQQAIDDVFKAQQDEEVAKAEYMAQIERNKTVELEAEGKAIAAQKEAEGKAEAIKAIADAQAYEIEKALESEDFYLRLKQVELEEKRMEKWDGRYPMYFMHWGESDSVQSFILPLPGSGNLPIAKGAGS